MEKKILFGIIAIVVLLAGGCFVLSRQNAVAPVSVENEQQNFLVNATTTIDTSNWKTYRNEEFKFEFKYPEDRIVQASTNNEEFFVVYPQGFEWGRSPLANAGSLNFRKFSGGFDVFKKNYTKDYFIDGVKFNNKILESEQYVVNGVMGTRMIGDNYATGEAKYFLFIPTGKTGLVIEYKGYLGEKILSTFKFTKLTRE